MRLYFTLSRHYNKFTNKLSLFWLLLLIILVLVFGGVIRTMLDTSNPPHALGIDNQEKVYVVQLNSISARIRKYEEGGRFLADWDTHGQYFHQYDGVVSLAADKQNNLYLCDKQNNRIEKHDSNGNLLLMWGAKGSDAGFFDEPHAVALDDTGNVYVADTLNGRIQKFDANVNFLSQWKGEGEGSLVGPLALAIDKQDNIYVSDEFAIKKFDNLGHYLKTVLQYDQDQHGFGSIATDGSNLYVADKNHVQVLKFDSNGNLVGSWGGTSPLGTGYDIDSKFPIVMRLDHTQNNKILSVKPSERK